MSRFHKPPLGTLLGRGLRLRCPRCGEGPMFQNLFRMHERCDHCDLKYERAPGYFLGSAYINYALTSVILLVGYVSLRFGAGISNRTLTPFLVAFFVLFPLMFYRYARALWISFDSFFDTEEFWSDYS